jgi:flavin reductase (DIM6/NTAB) family NADH-FMN oxidoreductase RutF
MTVLLIFPPAQLAGQLDGSRPDMHASPPDFDSTFFRSALGRFPTGVTVITASLPGQAPVGLTASSFNSVSLDPPLVVWSLSRNSSSLATIQQCKRYVIQVLASDQMMIAQRFSKGTAAERFNGVSLITTPNGSPRLQADCAAWFECSNRSQYEEGDHIIFVGEVEHCGRNDSLPLIYHAGGYDLTPPETKKR